ncbi:unnamed protein product [Adineta steineri]|uniref:Uncharacterized protein n=1 Tax=Adineta steineri TaxID=433720 RepID=A0A818ZB40_9BILA|nr:unnamed protein product [Adineta steineri]CAF3765994.1 unnamed protein product [Adineta steineri]
MYYDSNLQIHQQQYTTYNTNNTSDISSSAPTTNNGARQKKNSTNQKLKRTNEEVPIKKSNETSVLTPTTKILPKEIGKPNDSSNGISDEKFAIKNDNETTVIQIENESTKIKQQQYHH